MVGRKPKPSALVALHGRTSHGRKKNLAEPKPTGMLADVEPPDWLTPDQRAIWERLVVDTPRGLLTGIDAALVAAFVVAVDLHRQACKALAADGRLTVTTPNGMPVASPLIGVANRQAALVARLGAELGFSPCSRTRIAVTPPRPGDDAELSLGQFLARRPVLPTFN